ncbi:MAG: hypothetical protein FWF00_03905 [Endomicrobia bacterium]|nr:hypothetical protein [Endomicrobiia bacterium]MCL2506815.1 hypothetical protein [Endomicrobiia bacterium]
MQLIALIIGLLAILGMLIGFVPLLGWFNWLNIPFATLGLVISVIALAAAKKDNNGKAIGALILCLVAMFFGAMRLFVGLGVV